MVQTDMSRTQYCIEQDHALLTKQLQNEAFTAEEINQIYDCAARKLDVENGVAIGIFIFLAAAVALTVGWGIGKWSKK